MKKNVPLEMLTYEMLLDTSKKSRKKPDEYLDNLVKKDYYNKNKRWTTKSPQNKSKRKNKTC
tara:strand:+ start:1582 stop:1767 length:186 start_codon:yes stop_codon:yes gene_type:complete